MVRLDVSGALGSGDVTLENGGSIVDNFDGGAAPHATGSGTSHGASSGASYTAGILTVGDGISFLDFGAGNSGATFTFSGAGAFTGTLEILNWNDAPGVDGGLDDLIFGDGSSADLTADQLADIEFINPDGMTGAYAARQGSDGSLFANATPIGGAAAAPEPGTVALLGIGGLPIAPGVLRRRRRFLPG